MKTIITIALLLSGCTGLLTVENARYASSPGLCSITDAAISTTNARKIAYDELQRRGDVCNYNTPTYSYQDSVQSDAISQRRSEALLNFGAQMLNNSQPQPIYAPSQTVCRQQGIYTYCNQY